MIRLLFLGLCLLYTMPSCVEVATARPQIVSAIPALSVTNDTTITALQISKLYINVAVTGNIATTTFDISFYNPADKILEGEFDFPLADGQNISRYALDINGVLREGVVVEKVVARTAFEKTIRQKIDPGLVEKTAGNNFRTRIYPIPAKGYKRVVIGTEQPLASVKEGLVYKLPLYAEQPFKEFGITATINNAVEKPLLQNNTLFQFEFNKAAKDWTAAFHATDFVAGHLVEFIMPENNEMVYTEKFEGKTYFYVHTKAQPQYQEKRNPSTVTLLWDVSASGEKRNSVKEIALLSAYVERLEDVTVNLVPFHITVLPAEQFIIKNGNASALVQRIESFTYDGGTQLGSIDLNKYKDEEVLLFTDGISTFGKKDMHLSATPVTIINSSPGADFSYLKFVALQTHGRFINLTETETENAVDEMAKTPLQFISATYNNTEIVELFTQTNTQLQNGFSLAGILQKSTASVTLNYGYGNKISSSKTLLITHENTAAENVKRIWATTKIAQLDLEYEKNKEAITQLGKQFSVVTQNTSLLVLDRVEDYVEYEIVPPADLQKEYYTLLKEKQQIQTDEKGAALQEAIAAMSEIKTWYHQKQSAFKNKQLIEPDFTNANIGTINQEGVRDEGVVAYRTDTARLDMDYAYTTKPPPATTANGYIAAEQNKSADVTLQEIRFAGPPKVEEAKFTAPQIVKDEEVKDNALQSNIQLSEWTSEASYLKELGTTPVVKQFEKYVQLKKDYLVQPSFFVDVARFFYANNNKTLALQVLSNIAEMKLENPELLRIVANQLMEFGETSLAAEVFKEVLNIREEEPQSYRDLALAYTETGNYQEAVNLLYKIVLGTWDERFFSIKGIALNEMNAIISSHPNEVTISAIDKKFIQPMPVDVRIVIGWSSNDSDVDLWVTDPAKEKCSYQNNTTRAGGKISGDITEGYGPEEFCVRKATNGSYDVDVNLFGDTRQTLGGPITIKAELFTNFGKPGQQRKVINCRITSNKEVVRIGALQFGRM